MAEVQVNGNFDSVGNAAFSALFGYITGEKRVEGLDRDDCPGRAAAGIAWAWWAVGVGRVGGVGRVA
ncbi:hypothetical protein BH23ACT6_BH23ACT6_06300 [soil metagenome]